jgi:hypothetical protein
MDSHVFSLWNSLSLATGFFGIGIGIYVVFNASRIKESAMQKRRIATVYGLGTLALVIFYIAQEILLRQS